ncbi:methyl-accepting chemotaxis protein [Massilia consociata]|uniref:Methyl-accepting chemotaxis protein n=1 Tax=Massilia consociata TaxID=760117 RepID=A0ABV6FJD0_9BURK
MSTAATHVRMHVRTQLRIAFAFVIAISFLSAAVAIWRLQLLSQETEARIQHPLAKERLVSQWLLNLSVSAKRTAAVARSADPELAKVFAAESTESSRRTTELQGKVAALLDTPSEKALFDAAVEARGRFISSRDRVMQLKAAGNAAEAMALYDSTFMPSAQQYVDKVSELLALQYTTIDATGAEVLDGAAASTTVLAALCGLALAVSLGASALFSRALFRRLGGEPAEAARIANEIAAGNLDVRVELRQGDDVSLMHALLRMRDSLATIVGQVREGTSTIGASVDVMASEAQELSRRTESQAAALEQTASSMNELAHAVQHSAANAEEANGLAVAASKVAQQGGAMVGQLVDTMGSINESSARIVDIIAVIDGIAFQTNILALNAAVEAARAGEQGRGFAVVAGEVRSLAQRSAAAAKEIKELIDDSTQRVSSGAELAGRAGTTMNGIVESIARVTAIMAEIVDSSKEQASGIQQVHGAVADMDGVTQQNATLVEESAAATESMKDEAARLAQLVALFKLPKKPARATAPAAPRIAAAAAKAAPATPATSAAPPTAASPAAAAAKAAGAGAPARRARTGNRPSPASASAERAAAAEDAWEEF